MIIKVLLLRPLVQRLKNGCKKDVGVSTLAYPDVGLSHCLVAG